VTRHIVWTPNPVYARGATVMLATAFWASMLATSVLGNVVERQSQHGPVKILARLEPEKSSIGDPLTLTLRATAEKEVELLMPDFGEALDRFNILDFTQQEQVNAEGQTVMEQVYQLEPPRSGTQSIPPIMIEFVDRRPGMDPAPEGLDAYELLTERLEFKVTSVIPDKADTDLHSPFATLPPLATPVTTEWSWFVGALIATTVVMAISWPLWLKVRQRARRRSAYDLALTRLDRLTTLPYAKTDQIDIFFVELSAIVRWYVENRFELRAPESTTEEFLVVMSRSPDLTSDHQTLLFDFLRRADLVKFANFIPAEEDIIVSVNAARRFLEETRHDAPMLDPHDPPRKIFETTPPGRGKPEVMRA